MLACRRIKTYVHEVVSQASSRIRSALSVLDQAIELRTLLLVALVRDVLGLYMLLASCTFSNQE